jgi:iron complex outermembrane receptor protein
LPASSAHYPHAFARAFGIDGQPLDLYWTAAELGPRRIATTSEQWNAVAGGRGVLAGWGYDAAVTYSRSDADVSAAGGYVRESVLFPILNSGVVNPFGRNDPTVVDLLSTARFDGHLREGRATTASFDVVATRDVVALPAGPLSIAAGYTLRRETLELTSDPALERGDVLNLPSAASYAASRNAWAVFSEANVPLSRTLEADVAVRYDHFDDFGGTTNPRLSLRWQPAPTLVLRGSAGTGFLAPGLPGVYQPEFFGLTPPGLNDPARCPVTQSLQDCNGSVLARRGGNPSLVPVKSRQGSLGGVWAPVRDLSIGIDFVAILLEDRINFFAAQDILSQCPDGSNGPSCHLIRRGPVDPGNPSLPGPVVEIDQRLTNLGTARTSAIDVSIQYATPATDWGRVRMNFTGTYNIKNEQEQLDGSQVDQVNRFSAAGGNPGVSPHWRHYLLLAWNRGPWLVSLADNYQSGTNDQPPAPGSGATTRRMDDYDLWDLGVFYTGFHGWTLSAGIKNLFDRDPPLSVQTQSVQVGYDPSYADPRGRLYWAGVRYTFR